jgi:hypothetical protein
MSWPAFEATARNWLVAACGTGASDVIYGQQNGPRPSKPYASLTVTSIVPQQAVPDICPLDNTTAIRKILTRYEVNLSSQFYGATSLALAGEARNKLYTNPISAAFKNAGCPVQRTGAIQRIPEVVGSLIEDRYAMDVTLGICCSEEEALNWIEHVRLTVWITDGGTQTLINAPVDLF